MPILVKSDDVRSGSEGQGSSRAVTGGYGRHRSQWVKLDIQNNVFLKQGNKTVLARKQNTKMEAILE